MTNRLKRIEVNQDFIFNCLFDKFHARIRLTEIPDMQIRNIFYSPTKNIFTLIIESENFDLVKEGAEIPLLDIVYFRGNEAFEKFVEYSKFLVGGLK